VRAEGNNAQMQHLLMQHHMVNKKEQYPVENHISHTGNPISEELKRHGFTEGWIEEINEPTNSLTCMYE